MDAPTSASFISTREVLSALHGGQPPLIIDVRRKPVFRAATDMIAGALWRDPERVADWAGELPRATRVVAYCVHGQEISGSLARALAQLRRRPRDAQARYGDVRRALRLVQGRAGRGAHVESRWVPVG